MESPKSQTPPSTWPPGISSSEFSPIVKQVTHFVAARLSTSRDKLLDLTLCSVATNKFEIVFVIADHNCDP